MKNLFVVTAAIALLCFGGIAQAITIDTVAVGNAGNAGELSGYGAGGLGFGPDRVCGSVGYNYNIGKYEVTAGQYTAFLKAVAATDTYGLYNTDMSRTDYGSGITRGGVSGSYTYSAASDFVNRPVNYVNWGDSARFANWLHNGQPTGLQVASTTEDGAYYLNGAMTNAALNAVTRESDWTWAVTSEDEWYKAAYHKNDGVTGNYWDYPTSSDYAPGQDMVDVSGNNANYYTPPYAYPIDSGKYTTVAGEFQDSDSPYGTFDQGGNLWEWNEAIVIHSVWRGLRGGSFGHEDWYESLMPQTRNGGYYPSGEGEYQYWGFRVSEVPEPSSIIALLGGLTGLIGLRRRKA